MHLERDTLCREVRGWHLCLGGRHRPHGDLKDSSGRPGVQGVSGVLQVDKSPSSRVHLVSCYAPTRAASKETRMPFSRS